MTFNCPHCSRPLDAQDDMAGLDARCQWCKNTIRIPAKPDALPVVPAARPIPPPIVPPLPLPLPQTSGMAIASMTLGIISMLFGWMCCGPVLSILAIILGHIAFSRISRQPQVLTGKGMAIAGFVTGYVSLVGGLIVAAAFGVWALTMGAILGAMSNVLQQMPK